MSVQNDCNIDPSLQDAPQPPYHHHIQEFTPPPRTQDPVNPSPTKRRRASKTGRKSTDLEGLDIGDGDHSTPKAKRARPSPRANNTAPGSLAMEQNLQPHLMAIPEFGPTTTAAIGMPHITSHGYSDTHLQQLPLQMEYVQISILPKKLLPPKHDTAKSLTGYLGHALGKAASSPLPPTIDTGFTLPWSFGVPRNCITVPISPGIRSLPVRDFLYRLTLGAVQEEQAVNGDDRGKGNEMEALVNLARKSMDVQNCLTEVAKSLVKMIQGADGFSYAMSSASRVPLSPREHIHGASQGMLGGNWDIVFVCTCSDEAKSLPENSRVPSVVDNAGATDAQEGKHFACQGRILISFLEQEEIVILKYRHCAIHRPSRKVTYLLYPQFQQPERTIVGGVVSRKAPNPPPQPVPQQHMQDPNGAITYSNYYSTYPQQQQQQQQGSYVLMNGQWYYPQHNPNTGHYSQYPQQTSPPRTAPQQYQTHADPSPGESMVQIYSAAMAQYGNGARARKGRNSISDATTQEPGATNTEEQVLMERLTRELAVDPPPTTSQPLVELTPDSVQQGQGQHHGHQQQQQSQHQTYGYAAQYPYPSPSTYAHSAVVPLAGGAELGSGTGSIEGGIETNGTQEQGQDVQMVQGNERPSEVDKLIVKDLVEQLVQKAAAVGAVPSPVIGSTATTTASPPTTMTSHTVIHTAPNTIPTTTPQHQHQQPSGSESPETKNRRRGNP